MSISETNNIDAKEQSLIIDIMNGIVNAKDEEEMNHNIEKLYKSNAFLTKGNLRNYL